MNHRVCVCRLLLTFSELPVRQCETSARLGFFGINLASTGCGKTLANGLILYALADPERGARFSIALGLRTLTLQTGEAYREKLGLDEDDLEIRVDGVAMRELFEQGSESAASLLDNGHVHYEANLEDGPLKDWLQHDPLAHKPVSAPALACTCPDFESESLHLASHDLLQLLPAEALAIDAAPRIVEASPLQAKTRLADLEHPRLGAELLSVGASNVALTAALWWQTAARLSGVMQHAQPFRQGRPQLDYALLPDSNDEPPCVFHRDEQDGTWRSLSNLLQPLALDYGPRIHSWGHLGCAAELSALAEQQGLNSRVCAMRYGYVSLDCQRNDSGTLTDQAWRWHDFLGFTRQR